MCILFRKLHRLASNPFTSTGVVSRTSTVTTASIPAATFSSRSCVPAPRPGNNALSGWSSSVSHKTSSGMWSLLTWSWEALDRLILLGIWFGASTPFSWIWSPGIWSVKNAIFYSKIIARFYVILRKKHQNYDFFASAPFLTEQWGGAKGRVFGARKGVCWETSWCSSSSWIRRRLN